MDARRRRGRWLQGGATRERLTSRRTYDADAYGKTVWFWHPWLVSSCRWRIRSNRIGCAIKPAAMEAKGIRLQGERGISRQPIAQGMPECSGCTCMLVCATLYTIAHETAGAASTRHSLLPLLGGKGISANLGRNASRECRHTFSCRHPRRRVTQYSRDVNDRTERPRRTGYPPSRV